MQEQNSNFELSDFVAGFWRLKEWGMSAQERLAFIEKCLELGITGMDHAMIYRSEALFGEALVLKPELRQQMKIVTKFGIRLSGLGELGANKTNFFDNSASTLRASLDNSLQDLKTDYVDLLLVHRPDFLMNCEELAEQFYKTKEQGKALHFGVSNFSQSQFELLQSYLDFPLVTNQVEFSPYEMQALSTGEFDQCYRHKIRPMLWSCLGAGSVLNPKDEKGHRIFAALKDVAEQLDVSSIEQVIYAWINCLPCKPYILTGSSKIERIKTAVGSSKISLSHEQWYQVWEASNGAPVP